MGLYRVLWRRGACTLTLLGTHAVLVLPAGALLGVIACAAIVGPTVTAWLYFRTRDTAPCSPPVRSQPWVRSPPPGCAGGGAPASPPSTTPCLRLRRSRLTRLVSAGVGGAVGRAGVAVRGTKRLARAETDLLRSYWQPVNAAAG